MQPTPNPEPPAYKPRILIAEDEHDIRANLSRLLRMEGFDVQIASNGREALEMIHAQLPALPDLVLTDMMMPELSGSQLLQALRSDPRTESLMVVLLTARADSTDVQEGLAQGAADYITKPFQRDVLLSHIRALLHKRAAEAARPQAAS
jgi:DNA-binding response OmpR family regulator